MSSRNHLYSALLVLAGTGALTGCGIPGAPQPPSLQVPRPVEDLTASRKGDRVLLTWTPATQTTDGENIRHGGTTEVCRGINDFPMVRCDEKVATLNDAQVEHWTKGTLASRRDYTDTIATEMQQRSPLGFATYAISDLNPNGRTAGLSKQVRVSLAPTLPPPTDIKTDVTADGVVLTWNGATIPPENPSLHYLYRIFRRDATDDKKPEVIAGEVRWSADDLASFTDRNIEWEQHYIYRVAAITVVQQLGKESGEVEGDDTSAVEAFTHDVFPPAIPAGVQAVFSGTGQKPFIDLTWAPNLESDLAGYNVYRHESDAVAAKINTDLVKTPAFRDDNVESGHQYYYSVSAVDERGNESARSEETSEKVPLAQQ
jgi:hypothetical protein